MIYDKIKIYVSARIAEILDKDAEAFEFFKKDGKTVNKNAFLSRLIVHYSDEFHGGQSRLLERVKTTVQKHAYLKDETLQALCF